MIHLILSSPGLWRGHFRRTHVPLSSLSRSPRPPLHLRPLRGNSPRPDPRRAPSGGRPGGRFFWRPVGAENVRRQLQMGSSLVTPRGPDADNAPKARS